MSEINEHVAGDFERKRLPRRVLDNRSHQPTEEPAKIEDIDTTDKKEVPLTVETSKITENPGMGESDTVIPEQLSSMREEMRDFCDSIDKFSVDNDIVYKNGEVVSFWGSSSSKDQASSSSPSKTRWWSSKERREKVKEMMKNREKLKLSTSMDSQLDVKPQCVSPSGKRTHEIEGFEMSRKKLSIGSEAGGGDPEWAIVRPERLKEVEPDASASSVTERCRRHSVRETRRESIRPSALIDSCISSLINETSDKLSIGSEAVTETVENLIETIVDKTNDIQLGETEAEEFEEMDAALKARIMKNMNAPKTEEQRERGRKSASDLMIKSREAMARGKLPEEPEVESLCDYDKVRGEETLLISVTFEIQMSSNFPSSFPFFNTA